MRFLRIALALAAPFALVATLAAQSLEVQLQRAVQREIASGDSKAAIVEYKRIADRAGSNRAVAAEALLRLAEAHQRLGFADANSIYEQIVARYSDQVAIVATARARLNRDTPPATGGLVRRRVWAGRAIERVQGRARISPDGRLLAFASNNSSELIVRDLATGLDRTLIRNSSAEIADPTWSRDGKRLAFRYGSSERAEVRVINADGSAVRTAMRNNRDVEFFRIVDWGREEDILAFGPLPANAGFRLFWIAATTGATRTLADFKQEVHLGSYVSPDGTTVVTAGIDEDSGDNRMRLVSANGSSIPLASTLNDYPVGWTADGRHVLVVSRRGGTIDLWALSVSGTETGSRAWRVDRDLCACGEVDRAMAGQTRANIRSLGVTRAGSFYFQMLDFVSDIHTTSVGATSTAGSILPVKVSRDGFNRWPVWSPDGKRIAYVRVPTTGRELSVLDLASGAEQRIPNVARDRAQVCWAGNDAIVWRRLKEGLKELEFRRYTLSTQTDALLFEEPVQDAVGFGCSYDGTTVVYVNPATRMLTVRTVNGIKREALALPAGAALNSETFALSPNGEELALFVTPPAERTTSLIVLRLATGERRQIAQAKPGDRFSRAKGVAWSRDGKFLLYAQGNESSEEFELIRVEASGGIAQRLGIRAEGLSDLDVGPNGTIAFRAGPMDMPQVVAIENVSIPAK